MNIELWGVRGSLPSPESNFEYRLKLREILQRTVENPIRNVEAIEEFLEKLPENLQYQYGGNSTSVSVDAGKGFPIILDCGTGIRTLGDIMMKEGAAKGGSQISIFLTHTHWDHIQGLPFFKPMYIPGNTLHFFSTIPDLRERLNYQQDPRFFPIGFEQTASKKIFHLLEQGKKYTMQSDIHVSAQPIKHPGGSTAFRFEQNGKVFIFATDAEFTPDYLEEHGDKIDPFFANTDLLVIDSQYTLNEAFKKFDWGHTSYTMAVNCAIRWNVKKLVLTHHEPAYSDEKLHTIIQDAVRHRNSMDLSLPEIFLAREGSAYTL